MESRTKIAYSNVTAGTGSATIALGHGEWEIENLSALMGQQVPSMNGRELGVGKLTLEYIDANDIVQERHNLASGFCTITIPLIMSGSKRIHGPSQVKSYLQHGGSSTYGHSIQMIYRRIRDEY